MEILSSLFSSKCVGVNNLPFLLRVHTLAFFAWLIASMRHMSRNHSPLQQAIAENTVGMQYNNVLNKYCFGDIFQATPTAAEESGFSYRKLNYLLLQQAATYFLKAYL